MSSTQDPVALEPDHDLFALSERPPHTIVDRPSAPVVVTPAAPRAPEPGDAEREAAEAEAASRQPIRTAIGACMNGPLRRLRPLATSRLRGALAGASRLPREVTAAGAIATAALALSLLAPDGDHDFPGAAFEATLLSRPSVPTAEAAEGVPANAIAVADVTAERLVEDPVFGTPLRAAASNPSPGFEAPEAATAPAGAGADGTDPVDGAAAVLAAATPVPADPALRLLEQLRARLSAPVAAAPPPTHAGDAVPAAGKGEPGFAVQLVAVSRRDQAADAWTRLERQNRDLLGGLRPLIVDPERRVSSLFRLRAGPLASEKEARTLCALLAKRKVDCLIVRDGA